MPLLLLAVPLEPLASANAASRLLLACLSQDFCASPFWSSQRSLATSYSDLAFVSASLRRFSAVSFFCRFSSAFATSRLALASALQTSWALPFIGLHASVAAL